MGQLYISHTCGVVSPFAQGLYVVGTLSLVAVPCLIVSYGCQLRVPILISSPEPQEAWNLPQHKADGSLLQPTALGFTVF